MIRIIIADDHGIVRKGLRMLLEQHPEFQVVGEAADGRTAVQMSLELVPDVVIMDISMPQLNGIEATTQIVRQNAAIRSVILSMHSDEVYVMRALTAGAKGYLLKDSAETDLLRAVEAVSRGKCFFSPAIAQTLMEEYVRQLQQRGLQDSYDLLTDREREILQLLAEGKSNKEVATLLEISLYTVETHRNNLMRKLNLHNTAEIVLYAVRKKLIS